MTHRIAVIFPVDTKVSDLSKRGAVKRQPPKPPLEDNLIYCLLVHFILKLSRISSMHMGVLHTFVFIRKLGAV